MTGETTLSKVLSEYVSPRACAGTFQDGAKREARHPAGQRPFSTGHAQRLGNCNAGRFF